MPGLIPPGFVLSSRRGASSSLPTNARYAPGVQLMLTTSEDFDPVLNGVQPTLGTCVRVQLVRQSPREPGDSEMDPMWEVVALGRGFADAAASQLDQDIIEGVCMAAMFPISRVPQSALSAMRPLSNQQLAERKTNLAKFNAGLHSYLNALPGFAEKIAEADDLAGLERQYQALSEHGGSAGGPPKQQQHEQPAEEASTGAAVSSKRDGAPAHQGAVTPQAKKPRTRPPTHLVVQRDCSLKAQQTVPVGLIHTK
jgi:hypothetical protein